MKRELNSEKEKIRLQTLHDYYILDSLRESDFDRITELASLICGTPISLISLIDEDRQWFKSKVGLDIHETSRDVAFCDHTIKSEDIFEVEDATLDERFKNNVLVQGEPNIRFYTGYPLIDPNGFALGTLCVIDRVPKQLTPNQKRALKLLAEEAMTLVVERRIKQEDISFRKLFFLSLDLICIAGVDGYFKKINPAFEEILGWDFDSLLKISFFDFVHPDDLSITKIEIEKLASGHNTVNFVHRFKTKDGGYKVLQWVATPEVSTGNLFARGRDITEEVEKNRQLTISQEKLKTFFEHSHGLMCTHNLEGDFLSVNDAGSKILGYAQAEITQLSLFDIVPDSQHIILQEYLDTIQKTGKAKGEMLTLTKNGDKRIWLFNNILEKNSDGTLYVIGNAVDITDKHFLEKDLQRTKAILEQTNRVARVGGWELDVKKQKMNWTSVTKEIHGVSPDYEPDLQSGIGFYKEGDTRQKITDAVNVAIGKGTSWDLELQIVNAQKKELWVRAIGNAEFNESTCVRLFGTFQDIDDRKRAELEFSKSKKLLDDVLQAASEVSIIASDLNGTITVFNKGAAQLLGYSASEMIGKQTPAILHDAEEVAARGKELGLERNGLPVEGFQVLVEKAQISGSEQREWTYIKKDGTRLTVSLVITSIRNDENIIIGYLGIATNITGRKRTENALAIEKARLSAFVEHAPAAVAMLDNQMNYIAASHKWLEDYELIGRQVIGVSHYDLFPNLAPQRKQLHQKVLKGNIERNEEDIYRQPGTDKELNITWEMRPWYVSKNKIGGMMIFTQDISLIVKQREELKNSKQLAEQASIAKSEFLANMSHEIRTPLNGVIGFTDLVLKTKLSEVQQQYLTIVNQSADALLGIINDILDFSKIEAGKLELDIEKCDLYEIGCQASDIINYQIQTKKLEMLLNISPYLPRFIWADAVRLKQILINLLGNAAKFTEKGEIELKIEALAKKDGLTTIRFSVRDTGIGIKKEKQSKIFDAFSQADTSTTKKYGGTGLGLTISNKLLNMMESKLQLKSVAGKGSIFYFEVAFKAEDGDFIEFNNIDAIKRALIVDDNDNNRTILNQMLLLKNIKSDEAKNGFEALQFLAEGEHYDVILIDYHMPYMDGIETIKKVRQSFSASHEELPIILLHSSAEDSNLQAECQELMVNQRLIKPVKMQDIYHALSRLHFKTIEPLITAQSSEISHMADAVKILIVEDNEINMFLIKVILERIIPDALLLEAKNGLEGIDSFLKNNPDLVFLDIQMPEMNGYEVVIRIRELEDSRHTPVIALTAGNVKGEREKCLQVGMDDFLVKPVVENTIFQILNKWLNRSEPIEEQSVKDNTSTDEHFNLSQLKLYYGDDTDMLQEIMSLLRRQLKESLFLLELHVVNKDLEEINRIGHKIHGTAATSGLPKLTGLAKQLEHLEVFSENDMEILRVETKAEIELLLDILEM